MQDRCDAGQFWVQDRRGVDRSDAGQAGCGTGEKQISRDGRKVECMRGWRQDR